MLTVLIYCFDPTMYLKISAIWFKQVRDESQRREREISASNATYIHWQVALDAIIDGWKDQATLIEASHVNKSPKRRSYRRSLFIWFCDRQFTTIIQNQFHLNLSLNPIKATQLAARQLEFLKRTGKCLSHFKDNIWSIKDMGRTITRIHRQAPYPLRLLPPMSKHINA